MIGMLMRRRRWLLWLLHRLSLHQHQSTTRSGSRPFARSCVRCVAAPRLSRWLKLVAYPFATLSQAEQLRERDESGLTPAERAKVEGISALEEEIVKLSLGAEEAEK